MELLSRLGGNPMELLSRMASNPTALMNEVSRLTKGMDLGSIAQEISMLLIDCFI